MLESTTKMTSPPIKKTDQNVHPGQRAHSHHCLSWHQAIDPMGEHAVGKHAGVIWGHADWEQREGRRQNRTEPIQF